MIRISKCDIKINLLFLTHLEKMPFYSDTQNTGKKRGSSIFGSRQMLKANDKALLKCVWFSCFYKTNCTLETYGKWISTSSWVYTSVLLCDLTRWQMFCNQSECEQMLENFLFHFKKTKQQQTNLLSFKLL